MNNISIWERFKALFSTERPKASTSLSDFTRWFSPTNIFTKQSATTLATNETIFAAVSRLANSVGSIPLKLLDQSFHAVIEHPVADLLMNSPNPNMTSFDFFRTMETLRDTTGNAYAMKEYDVRYQVAALWILDPGKVTELVDEKTKELWYEIKGDKGTYYVHNMDMVHVKHIHGYGYRGISPIEVLKGTIDYDRKVKQFSLDQIDGAITASFILKMSGTNVGKEKRDEILENFRDFYANNGGVLIQDSGVEITTMEKGNYIDTKIFEVEKITRTRVATVYNMPLHLLGEIDGVNFSSMEQMDLGYVQGTLVPIVRQYEQELNRKVLTDNERRAGLYWKFNLNALLRGDMKTRGDFYFKGIRSGMFKPNEVRALEDLPPEPGGDELLISGDLYPITQKRER